MDYLNFLGILLALVLIVVLWMDLRRIATDVQRKMTDFQRRLPKWSPHPHVRPPAAACLEEYNVWAYRGGQWSLERECSVPGLEVGPPPDRSGWYEGEVVRTRGIPKRGG